MTWTTFWFICFIAATIEAVRCRIDADHCRTAYDRQTGRMRFLEACHAEHEQDRANAVTAIQRATDDYDACKRDYREAIAALTNCQRVRDEAVEVKNKYEAALLEASPKLAEWRRMKQAAEALAE